MEYRVNLDVYDGPMDLLLYLIRREEVDIYDIPVARITEQFIGYVDVLQQVDPNVAGEFMLLAATLLEIKTRMLLPKPPPEDPSAEDADGDPRAELVRQLLEYKAFKDAAEELRSAQEVQALRFARRPAAVDGGEREVEIEDVQLWDLVDAFSRLMSSIGADARKHEVVYDDTPVELHAADLLDRLCREGPLTFRKVFEGRTRRSEIVGLFMAMLELVRQKKILASQDDNFGDIQIRVNPQRPTEAPFSDEQGDAQGPQQAAGEAPADQPAPGDAQGGESASDSHQPPPQGQYVSDGPAEMEADDDAAAAT